MRQKSANPQFDLGPHGVISVLSKLSCIPAGIAKTLHRQLLDFLLRSATCGLSGHLEIVITGSRYRTVFPRATACSTEGARLRHSRSRSLENAVTPPAPCAASSCRTQASVSIITHECHKEHRKICTPSKTNHDDNPGHDMTKFVLHHHCGLQTITFQSVSRV